MKTNARLRLQGGPSNYFFESLVLEPGGVLDLDNGAGPVVVNTRTNVLFRGIFAKTSPTSRNVLFTAVNGNFTIQSPFAGVVVAPRGVLDLATTSAGHRGAFYGNTVVAHQWTPITHEPLDTSTICANRAECDGLCPCPGGSTCATDGDCAAGLACALGQGPKFGLPPGTSACAPRECFRRVEPTPSSCGSIGHPCGLCDLPPPPCNDSADCGPGESCPPGSGALFGLGVPAVCVPTICTTDARRDFCGSVNAPCGTCTCSASCAGKTCGGDMSNGCGSQCPSLCSDRQPGCTADAHCLVGSVCIIGGGPRVGRPAGTNVCLPAVCADHDLGRMPCGSASSPCGACPTCTPSCGGRCGGPDGCGGTCAATCKAGEVCSEGLCIGPFSLTSVEIPDGTGGTRTPVPLDPGPTSPVGALAGVFGVSDTGKATYRIPIAVPPGRQGLQPGLALTYGGTQRNGVLGVGWHLEGLSAISRCRHTQNRDGFSAPVADDRTDRYCLDGVLIVEPIEDQNYGANGTIHYPEFDTRTRVVSFGTGPTGPDYFEVRRSNGLIYTYGLTDQASVYVNSFTKREWALERVTDRSGNYMTIEYRRFHVEGLTARQDPAGNPIIIPISETREIVPVAIKYTGFDGPGAPALLPNRAVIFEYTTDRPDRLSAYAAGRQTARSRRLKALVTAVGGQRVRSYLINYGDEVGRPADNGVSRIETIKECGDDNICKPPTTFEYYDDSEGAPTPGTFVPFAASERPGIFLRGDRNAERFRRFSPAPGFLARLEADGAGYDDILYNFGITLFEAGWALISGGERPSAMSHSTLQYTYTTRVRGPCDQPPLSSQAVLQPIGDFNNDGKDDLFDSHVFRRTHLRWLAGPSFTSQTILPNPERLPCDPSRQAEEAGLIVDITGDGLADIVQCTHDRLRFYRRSGVSSFQLPVRLPRQDACPDAIKDLDGDGTPNLVVDGAMLKIHGNSGVGVWQENVLPYVGRNPLPFTRDVDLNGDGLKDLVAIVSAFTFGPGGLPVSFEGGSLIHVWLNTGRGFVETPAGSFPLTVAQLRKALTADVNHDGQEELLIPLVTEIRPGFSLPANTWVAVGLGAGGLREVLRFDSGVPMAEPDFLRFRTVPHHGVMADVNGDGADDFVMIGFSNDPGTGVDKELFVLYGHGHRANLLKTVTDGLGKQISVRWDPGTRESPTYKIGSDCHPTRCDKRVPVVSQQRVFQLPRDGLGSPREERLYAYTYKDGRTNPADGKFLGFSERTIVESVASTFGVFNVLSRTTIQLENAAPFFGTYPLAGRRKLVRVVEPRVTLTTQPLTTSERVTETINTWGIDFGRGGAHVVLDERETRVSEVLFGAGTAPGDERLILRVNEEFDTDLFGNVTRVTRREHTSAGSLGVNTVSLTFRNQAAEWLIGLPERQIVTDTLHLSDPFRSETRTTAFTQYPTGQLFHVIREPGSPSLQLDRELKRDAYGNVRTAIEKAATGETRTGATVYDADQTFPTAFTNGLGHVSFVDFDPRFGKPSLSADPNGIATQWAYDSFGRVTREQSPATQSTIDYLPDFFRSTETLPTHGAFSVVTQTAGFGRTLVGYDAFGRRVRQVSTGLLGEDVLTEALYDESGRLFRESRPHAPGNLSQGFTEYEYDALSRVSKIKQADATSVEFKYASRATVANLGIDAGPLLANHVWFTTTRNPRGHVSLSVLDQRGQIAASRDTGGAFVTFVPGPFATTPSVTAAGATSSYEFDRYGRVTRSRDPDRGEERYTYNAWGDLDQYFIGPAPTPAALDYGYDALGRLETIVSSDGTATNTYDNAGGPNEIGRLVSTTSFDGTQRHLGYEPAVAGQNRGFLRTVTDVVDGDSLTTELNYNGFGQLDRTEYPGASTPFVVDRRYDAGGNLQAVGSLNFAETYWELFGTHQGYLPAIERVGTAFTERTYHTTTGRLHTLTTTASEMIQAVEHLYDANGNLEFRTNVLEPAETRDEQFIYDNRDRLIMASRGSAQTLSVAYTPDGSGNIRELSGVGLFGYDNPGGTPSHGPRTAGSMTMTYDPSGTGNVTNRTGTATTVPGGTQSFAYDRLGQTTRIGIAGDINAVRLKYQASGERASKTTSTGRSIRYSGDYERETTAAATTEHRYRIYSPSGPIGEIVRGANDQELSRTYWHKDILGSPEVLTNASGAVLHRQRFDAFGTVSTPSWLSSNPAVRRVRRGYTGHEHDTETGLVNMGARLYDSTTTRFLAPDPLVQVPGWTQSHNRFAYVWNNPMNWVDPTGLEAVCGGGVCVPGEGDAYVGNVPGYGEGYVFYLDEGAASDTSTIDSSYSLSDFYPAGGPTHTGSAGAEATSAPLTAPASITQTPEGRLIEAILDEAMQDPDCELASCGATSGQVALENSSNIFNRPGQWANEARAAQHSAELLAYEKGGLSTPVDPLDFVGAGLMGRAAGAARTIEASAVRFTQSSVGQTLSTGENINAVAKALRGPGGDALAASFKPIRIFRGPGDGLYTLDNRRLLIFSQAGRPVPFVWATPQQVAAEAWKFTATPGQAGGWFIRVK